MLRIEAHFGKVAARLTLGVSRNTEEATNMGVDFVLISATDEMIEKVHSDPPLIWRLYAPEDVDLYLSKIGANRKPSIIDRLLGKQAIEKPNPLPSFSFEDGERFDVDLDRSWDGMNFCIQKLLLKEVPNIFVDGEAVGTVDLGYGPALTFDSSRVKRMFGAYKEITAEKLAQVLDPEMFGPYSFWRRWDIEAAREYLVWHYNQLVDFLGRAADRGLGIVVVYT